MKNVDELREILGETMKKVMAGTMTADQARAIAQVGAVVCDTAKIEIDMAKATDGDFKGSGFIDVDPSPVKHRALTQIK